MSNLKTQDWTAHTINFILIFVSVIVGIYSTASFERYKAKKEAKLLLGQMYNDIHEAKCFVKGTEDYFKISQIAAVKALKNWNIPNKVSK